MMARVSGEVLPSTRLTALAGSSSRKSTASPTNRSSISAVISASAIPSTSAWRWSWSIKLNTSAETSLGRTRKSTSSFSRSSFFMYSAMSTGLSTISAPRSRLWRPSSSSLSKRPVIFSQSTGITSIHLFLFARKNSLRGKEVRRRQVTRAGRGPYSGGAPWTRRINGTPSADSHLTPSSMKSHLLFLDSVHCRRGGRSCQFHPAGISRRTLRSGRCRNNRG